MRVLVLGGGGREHALVKSLSESPLVDAIFAAPGNGGTASERVTSNVDVPAENADAVVAFARDNGVDLVVIGPEAPLVAGVADAARSAGIACFGPGAAGARLEGSKAFAKDLMARHGIPTAAARCFTDAETARDYLDRVGAPIVVKADGLAAGKGVTVAMELAEARAAVDECFAGRFGEAGMTVVIEEFLSGPECSLLAFVDGTTVLPMAPAQDHKRAFDNDEGPNTGGMGVYSPVPLVTASEYGSMVSILESTAYALAADGIEFRGVLYGGFVLTEAGPKVLEYNVRFGDPETQVILPRLETDLAEVLMACATGSLSEIELAWTREVAVSVVVASGGYPGEYPTGKPISGLEEAASVEGVTVYHAGTKALDGEVITSGGRVLNVTAVAPEFEQAIDRAYTAVQKVSFDGAFYRHDIGRKALAPRKQV